MRALLAGFAVRVLDLVDAGQDKEAGALILDDALDRFTFSGTPEQIAELSCGSWTRDRTSGLGTPHGLTDDRGSTCSAAPLPRLR